MDNTKFTLSPITSEEQKAFQADFNVLCEKHSIIADTMPRYEPMTIKAPNGQDQIVWLTTGVLFLQKKTPTESGIVSPLSEEFTGNEPPKTD